MADEKKTTVTQPVYTMDIMRLMQINELVKMADLFYIQMEAGGEARIIPLRATLKTLYSKIKRFCVNKYPEDATKIHDAFIKVDDTFNFSNIESNTPAKYEQAKTGLVLIKEVMDEIIDEVWVKTYEVLTEEERARLYNVGRA